MTQGWRWRPAQPALGLASVLTSGQFFLVFTVVIQRKNGQMSKIGWNFKVGLALEKLPAPPLHNGGRVGGQKIFDLLILHSGHSMGHTKVYMHFQYDFY